MWVKDIKKYPVEIYKEDEEVFVGNVDEAPEEIKNCIIKKANFDRKKLVIRI